MFAPDGLYYSVDDYYDDLKALDDYPIASTGAAAKKIYDEQFLDKNERLVKDYAYMSLFQKYLLNKI